MKGFSSSSSTASCETTTDITNAVTASRLDPWQFSLESKMSSPSALDGRWIALFQEGETRVNKKIESGHINYNTSCGKLYVAHAIPDEGNTNREYVLLWKLQFWVIDFSSSKNARPTTHVDNNETESHPFYRLTSYVANTVAAEIPCKSNYSAEKDSINKASDINSNRNTNSKKNRCIVKFSISALDRSYLPIVTTALSNSVLELKHRDWYSPCGFYTYFMPEPEENQGDREEDCNNYLASEANYTCIRHLTPDDARLVDSQWTYKSNASLQNYVLPMICNSSPTSRCCCFGIEVDGTLIAWILKYLDGPLGMLFVEENHRRKGYAKALVLHVMDFLKTENIKINCSNSDGNNNKQLHAHTFAYIVDDNEASEKLFYDLGWQRF
eukprot:CAMPEP_0194445548 /NCGR_PEP_ID=MMETSP0176-20130528/127928_1 /TAXON_ID=216777 /ORGANISM="Proboscia alata, Strain PI-D3" /LENGTH=383 /DNA_ID=CAMNT_0039272129 /DNA_START=507 /DNA_END=1655 /DNA_ORIENTATION=+